MKKQIILLFSMILSHVSQAADSSWLLCKGKAVLYGKEVNLVFNSYEHRVGTRPNGTTRRANELTFIYGGHKLDGRFDSSEEMSGKILLKNSKGERFRGTMTIDYGASELNLTGKLTLVGDTKPSPLNSTFICEELN